MPILISPYSRFLEGKTNPKNYPWWNEVISGIDEEFIQIGTIKEPLLKGITTTVIDPPLKDIKRLVDYTDIWISVDNFLQHYVFYNNGKRGIVVWGLSDPMIFGYMSNINLLKDRRYLRKNQFDTWFNADYREDVFISPDKVINTIKGVLR